MIPIKSPRFGTQLEEVIVSKPKVKPPATLADVFLKRMQVPKFNQPAASCLYDDDTSDNELKAKRPTFTNPKGSGRHEKKVDSHMSKTLPAQSGLRQASATHQVFFPINSRIHLQVFLNPSSSSHPRSG